MAHSKYSSACFLIGEINSGEDDKIFSLFTEEFGFIRAHAKSIRKQGAKLAGGFKKGTLLRVTLVLGKEFWRVVEVEELETLRFQSAGYKVFLRSTRLLQTLIHGEEKNRELFVYMERMFHALLNLETEKEKDAEIVFSLQILHSLGYVSEDTETKEILEKKEHIVLEGFGEDKRKKLISIINKGIVASHL